MGNERKYTKELVQEAVNKSISYAETCRNLGITAIGGRYELIKNRIIEYGIDVSHFLGRRACAGKRNSGYESRLMASDEIFNQRAKYRISHDRLKRYMTRKGVEYKCCICEINKWNNKKITLDIDHKDGDWANCKLGNLRFICPNCHRQTNTFSGKNIKVKKQEKQNNRLRPKVDLEKEKLEKLVRVHSLRQIGRMYDVNYKTIQRYCLKKGVDIPKKINGV